MSTTARAHAALKTRTHAPGMAHQMSHLQHCINKLASYAYTHTRTRPENIQTVRRCSLVCCHISGVRCAQLAEKRSTICICVNKPLIGEIFKCSRPGMWVAFGLNAFRAHACAQQICNLQPVQHRVCCVLSALHTLARSTHANEIKTKH